MAVFKTFYGYEYLAFLQNFKPSNEIYDRKATHEIKYIALIAGFVVFAPFSQTYINETTPAFVTKNEPYVISSNKTAILVARINIPKNEVRNPNKTYERLITAYSSAPDETDSTPFITASGSYVRFGVVAANWLPIGTAIRIPEYFGKQVFIVEDRMNSRHSKKVDVWLPSKEAALNFGKRVAKIEVL